MAKKVDRSVDLLNLFRGANKSAGLYVVKADTESTFTFEGSSTPLDLDLFEIPVSMYPIKVGDRFFVYPLVTQDNAQRWAVIRRINDGLLFGTVKVIDSVFINIQADGVAAPYLPVDLILPKGYVPTNGDRVSLRPTAVNEEIKYVILEIY